jgi:hypothetical protein
VLLEGAPTADEGVGLEYVKQAVEDILWDSGATVRDGRSALEVALGRQVSLEPGYE